MTWLLILGRRWSDGREGCWAEDVQGHVSTCVRVKPGWIFDGTSFVETETGILKANDVFSTFTWWFLCINLTRRCCDVSKVSTVSAAGRVCIQMFHKSFRFSRKEQSLDGSGYTAGGVDYPVSVVYPPQKKRHNRTTSLCVRGGLPSPLCLFLFTSLHFLCIDNQTFPLHPISWQY